MPRYHFNITDGHSTADLDGTELPDLAAAKVAAVQMAGLIIRDHAPAMISGEEWYMTVTDETGLTLFRLDFNMTLSPERQRTTSVKWC